MFKGTMLRRPRFGEPARGFTIVEMLVVVAIIAALAAILLPALGAAKRRSKKTQEQNDIRQLGIAWNLYGNNYNDAAIPGHISEEVQQIWGVDYDYPTSNLETGEIDIPPVIAESWVWRIMSYIDDSHDTLHRYAQEDYPAIGNIVTEEPLNFALTPGFGYNSFYVGGWWDIVEQVQDPNGQGTFTVARSRFFEDDAGDLLRVMRPSIGSVRRSSEVAIFTSSATLTLAQGGLYKEVDPFTSGSYFVTPTVVGSVDVWDTANVGGGTDPKSIQAKVDNFGYPAGRYNGQVVVLTADGHTELHYPGGIREVSRFIDTATDSGFEHTGEVPSPPF
jgi:prepilin-type N-terminal cleavage/methylation domain-containing protein